MDNNDNLSRRLLLQGATVAGASAALAGCGDDEPPPGPSPDIAILNRLLTAEYVTIAAYTAGGMILNTPPANDPLRDLAIVLQSIAARWQSHHREHAAVLASAITGLGGTPNTEAAAMFTPPSNFTPTVGNVLRLVANTEKRLALDLNAATRDLGVAANRFIATNIQGVQTQHFVVINALLKGVAQRSSNILMVNLIVPKAWVSTVTPAPVVTPPPSGMTGLGLQDVMDYTYT